MYHIGNGGGRKKVSQRTHNVMSVFSVLARCDPLTQFTCNSGRCIDIRQKCDGVEDCADYTDELYCPTSSSTNESKQTLFIKKFEKMRAKKCTKNMKKSKRKSNENSEKTSGKKSGKNRIEI